MSNTFYVPDETGWSGDKGRLRIKVEQTYDALTNQSTLVCVLQVTPTQTMSTTLRHWFGALAAGSVELFNKNTHGNYRVDISTPGNFVDMYNSHTGETVVFTLTVQHDDSGAASVAFTLGSTDGGNGFQLHNDAVDYIWGVKTATLNLSEQRDNIRIGINGEVKGGQLYIGIDNVPKLAELYIGVDGVPKLCI